MFGQTTTAPTFNLDFYAMAATVIPVFFLALTLQGRLFDETERLMKKHSEAAQAAVDRLDHAVHWESDTRTRQAKEDKRKVRSEVRTMIRPILQPFLFSNLIALVVIVVVSMSLAAEVMAVVALAESHAGPDVQNFVEGALVTLTCGIGLVLYARINIASAGPKVRVALMWRLAKAFLCPSTASGPSAVATSAVPSVDATESSTAGY
jgi:hypothetical protein